MTGGTKPKLGEVVAFARAGDDRTDDLLGAVVPARLREEPTGLAPANVIPFVRPRSNDNARPAGPELVVAARLAPTRAAPWAVTRSALFVTASLLVHGAIFAALWRDPPPLAGTELESISVEIVHGNNAPLGLAKAPSEVEGDVQQPSPVEQQAVEQVEEIQEKTTEQPQEVEVAAREVAPEPPPQPTLQAEAPREPQPLAAPEPTPVAEAPKPEAAQSVAMVQSPQAEIPTETARAEPPPPEKLTLLPQVVPEEKPVEPPKVIEAKPVPPKPEPPKREPARPAKQEQKKKKDAERKRIAARTGERTRERESGAPSSQGSNGTLGRAGSVMNYPGRVSAHLQRFKNPVSGEKGVATVRFRVDTAGRVTVVQLLKPSGSGRVDQEAQAMVRRASPFPAPPPGWTDHITVPVRFDAAR